MRSITTDNTPAQRRGSPPIEPNIRLSRSTSSGEASFGVSFGALGLMVPCSRKPQTKMTNKQCNKRKCKWGSGGRKKQRNIYPFLYSSLCTNEAFRPRLKSRFAAFLAAPIQKKFSQAGRMLLTFRRKRVQQNNYSRFEHRQRRVR